MVFIKQVSNEKKLQIILRFTSFEKMSNTFMDL
jgi:hypothetical protein